MDHIPKQTIPPVIATTYTNTIKIKLKKLFFIMFSIILFFYHATNKESLKQL